MGYTTDKIMIDGKVFYLVHERSMTYLENAIKNSSMSTKEKEILLDWFKR